jgi:hypothetical protein
MGSRSHKGLDRKLSILKNTRAKTEDYEKQIGGGQEIRKS